MVRLSGVYLAMLTLAFAQIVWAVAFQWVGVTGGDNGILGVWPAAWAAAPAVFYWLTLASAPAARCCCGARSMPRSATPCAPRATPPLRAEAIGLNAPAPAAGGLGPGRRRGGPGRRR